MTDRVGQHLANYHLVRLLGQGGQAEVYLGEHHYLNSFAALKVLRTHLSDQHARQFLAEAQTLARLLHPCIVRVLDFTVEDGTPVLIMDYAPKGTMRHRYPSGTCLPLSTVVSSVSQIASALQYAHSRHVIHRDVKPENMLLGSHDEVVLSDFGLSVFAPSPELLSTQALSGTLPYMAPEQLQGHPDFASDQYSLALVAYEWLTGRRPFTGSQWQLIQQQLYAPPPPLRTHNPTLSERVEAVVLRALSKDPRERYVSVQGFAQALLRAREVALHAAKDSEVTAPLLLARAEPQDESLASSSHSAQPLPSFVQPLVAQDMPGPGQPPSPSCQQQTKTEQHVSKSRDVSRQRLLAKVRAFWITGVLEHSLHGAARIALGLREHPDAVANPWHLVLASPGEPGSALPPGTPIAQVYDEAAGELLILGEPGSGKTTLLLELARTLLDRAERDERHPMPVVFNLSSWASKRQPLDLWLMEELNTKYQVPRKLAKAWVEADQVLPLLDGLDEVASTARSACGEAMNVYRLHHGLVPTVVCSRSAEYLAESVHLLLRTAVVVQPLTWQEIEGYLASAGEAVAPVHAALRADPELRELVTTPLMLSVLSLAYHGTSADDLLVAGTASERRRHVFERYTERMLSRRGTDTSYSPQHTTGWLAWLARQMKQHDQTIFSVERLQPDWLLEERLQHRYRRFAVQLPGLLMGGLIGAWVGGLLVLGRLSTGDGGFLVLSQTTFESCLLGLFLGFLFTRRRKAAFVAWQEHLSNGLILGLCGMFPGALQVGVMTLLGYAGRLDWGTLAPLIGLSGLSFGLPGLLISLLVKRASPEDEPVSEDRRARGHLWRTLTGSSALRNTLVCGLVGLLYGFVSMLGYGNPFAADPSGSSQSGMFGYIFAQMLSFCTSFGMVGLLASTFIQRAGTEQIQPTEVITWSWGRLLHSFLKLKHLGYAVLIGLVYGSLYGALGLIFGVQSFAFWRTSVLSVFGIVALVSWLLIGLFGGWSGAMLDERKFTTPNEGIRRSAFYGLLFGLLSWLVYGEITWLVRYLASFTPLTQFVLPDTWLKSWFLYGLPGALAIGLLVGGWACLKHAVLRRQLRKTGHIPSNYPRFLDYAAERILLRKVGGGYIFVHRLLLDYFASLDSTPHQERTTHSEQHEAHR